MFRRNFKRGAGGCVCTAFFGMNDLPAAIFDGVYRKSQFLLKKSDDAPD